MSRAPDLHELRARLRYDPETGEFMTLARTDSLGKHYKEKKHIHGEFLP